LFLLKILQQTQQDDVFLFFQVQAQTVLNEVALIFVIM